MKILKNKIAAIAITLILLFSISGIMTAIPTSKAQTEASPTPTQAYIALSPNPAGINQVVTLEMWLGEINPTAEISGGGRWGNFTVLVTLPSGTSQTLGPFTANDASFAVTTYTPAQLGNYTFKFSFPGQHVTGIGAIIPVPVDIYYGASTFTTTLAVQQQAASTMPQTPLPTSYWTNPINSQNSLWSTISGNWLALGGSGFGATSYNATGNFNPYTTGPGSAHILWTKPLQAGGLMGGEFGGGDTSNYYTGRSYQSEFGPPVIINGVLYYNAPASPFEGFYAVDLHTGQTLWFQNTTTYAAAEYGGETGINIGQVYNFLSPNDEGGLPYLWFTDGSTWKMYDANTGDLILQIANVPSGTFPSLFANPCVEGPNGELLVYVIGSDWLAMWNSSLCILTASTAITGNIWQFYPPIGATLNFSTGIQWNVTTPNYSYLASPLSPAGQGVVQVNSGIVLCTAGGNLLVPESSQLDIAYSATTGQQLWVKNITYPSGPSTSFDYYMGPMADGVFTVYNALAEQWYGYSTATGDKLWTTVADTNAWGSEPGQSSTIAYGILYGLATDGIHAYNLTTGNLLWNFDGTNSGTNFPGFNTYPFVIASMTVADGMIYVNTGVSHGDPNFRGAQLYCINATTGKLIWSISDFSEQLTMPISDGILVVPNMYDNQLYAYGMGPSKTTVTAPDVGVTTSTPVTITGTVTDISAGAQQQAVAANFPNGLPCVSDASMTQWMEYVYMQQPCPTNTTGVPVTISVIDSNGNTRQIGTTTSNAYGTYSLNWTPNIPGNYTVIASFAGTQSYYPSTAATAFYASVPSATPAPTAAPLTGLATMSGLTIGIAAAVIAIIIAIAIVGLLLIRKKP